MLHKSTWKVFIEEAKKGLAYCGSSYSKSLSQSNEISRAWDVSEFYVDRLMFSGTTVLNFKTDRKTISRLDKRGKVWKNGNIFTIVDDGNIIVYAIPTDRDLRLVSWEN